MKRCAAFVFHDQDSVSFGRYQNPYIPNLNNPGKIIGTDKISDGDAKFDELC